MVEAAAWPRKGAASGQVDHGSPGSAAGPAPFSHEQLVGAKCRVTRGFFASQAFTLGWPWVA